MSISTKVCNRCKETKPATLEYFYKHISKDGLRGDCISCVKILDIARRARRRKNKQEKLKREHPLIYAGKTKICRKCKKEKLITEFVKSKVTKDGFLSRCKKCTARESNIKRHIKLGVTQKDYDNMLRTQDFKCAICGKTVEENGKFLALDHNHNTMQTRGLLCIVCNQMLGQMKENINVLKQMIDYLNKWKTKSK